MVKISNCGHDENGRYAGGKAGDQTGTEYQIMNWYSRPWLCVLRFNDAKIAAMIADMATKAAQNNLIGYDQGTAGNSNDRYSFWQHLKASNYDPAQITVACESDCSASTAAIVKGAGYRLNNAKLKAVSIYLTTRNMRAAMKIAGAKVLTDRKYLTSGDYLKAGDILLNDNHHVAIAVTTGAKANTLSASTILSKTPKWVGKVTANTLNVRTWAGTEYAQLKSYPTLAKGNLVDVCDTIKAKNGASWYYIRIAGKYFGFVSTKYICKV